VYDVGVESTDS